MDAMNNDPLEQDIEGILNQEIIDIFNSLEGQENQGLSEADIRKKFKIRMLKTPQEIKSMQDSCVICLCDYKLKQNVITLTCKHEFHFDCIKQWLDQNTTCPKCRKEFQ